ncbi:MAG: hypothetical protein IT161_03990 [Bryobacterales bacterium]|nr:hypothetical protein [Bryobacterales bacterium]
MAEPTQERLAEMRRRVEQVKRFMDAIKLAGGRVPGPLAAAVMAFDKNLDIWAAYASVEAEIRMTYEKNRKECDLTGEADEYGVCQARDIHFYQALSTRKVLGLKDDHSIPRLVWRKWKPELAEWLRNAVIEQLPTE